MKESFQVQAIPTVYAGVQMRSRLEAQAAALFDKFGWSWQYEPFSMMLPSGIAYTPDFCVRAEGWIIECRGYETERSRAQLDEFILLVERRGGLAYPASDGEDCNCYEYLLIGPSTVRLYSAWETKHSQSPASERRPYESQPPLVFRCRCGWGFMNNAGWCPNCQEYAIQAVLVGVSEGKILVNGSPLERFCTTSAEVHS